MSRTEEINFDGIVGPTHNYAGLSYGNLASRRSGQGISNPRAAALEGLVKMKQLADMGVAQAVLPPQDRPDVAVLRRLGFGGSDAQVVQAAYRADPVLLAACYSASSMWAANAATVSPGADTADGRVHFTPANLLSQFHRSIESSATARILQTIFTDEQFFAHHPALPAAMALSDEGAANHLRLAPMHTAPGIELLVYGQRAFDLSSARPAQFPARQTLEASSAVARLHQLDPQRTLFVQQNPAAIDAGVFHNDVIAVGNQNVLLYHARAFVDTAAVVRELASQWEAMGASQPLICIQASEDEVPLADAVASYLFNSQLVTLPDDSMALIAPMECQECESARGWIDRIIAAENPVRQVNYVDVRQSMNNGGGPACLRLRIVLTSAQKSRMLPSVLLTDTLYNRLVAWVNRHYREQLAQADLADPMLLEESRRALDELTRALDMGYLYRFQR